MTFTYNFISKLQFHDRNLENFLPEVIFHACIRAPDVIV